MKAGVLPRGIAIAESLVLLAAVACLVAAGFLGSLWSILLGISLALLALGLPSAISLLLGAVPLEPGPLLERGLRRLRRSSRTPFPELRTWDGPGSSRTGALAAGLLARSRTLFLSRSLLERLDGDALVAVCAHELAHLERRHPGIILLAVLASVLPLGAIRASLEPAGASWAWGATALYGAVALLWVVPRLSRRLELEADIHAAEWTGKEAYLALLWSEAARGGLRHPSGEERAHAVEEAFSAGGGSSASRNLRLAVLGWFLVSAGVATGSWIARGWM